MEHTQILCSLLTAHCSELLDDKPQAAARRYTGGEISRADLAERYELEEQREAAVVIQSACRGKRARRERQVLGEADGAAGKIQAACRGKRARRQMAEQQVCTVSYTFCTSHVKQQPAMVSPREYSRPVGRSYFTAAAHRGTELDFTPAAAGGRGQDSSYAAGQALSKGGAGADGCVAPEGVGNLLPDR